MKKVLENKGKKIVITNNERKMPWPYIGEIKALSSSSLTDILKLIEYQEKQIPKFILIKAAENGKVFHKTIQVFLENKNDSWHKKLVVSRKTNEKIEETILFLKEKNFSNFLGSEKLYHNFYQDNLFGTYVDLDFKDFVIELKTNNIVINESKMSVLAFRIQLLIQKICTKKDIYLLWSTGNGICFEKFEETKYLFEILEILVDILKNKEVYSFEAKKEIVEKVLSIYSNSIKSFLIE